MTLQNGTNGRRVSTTTFEKCREYDEREAAWKGKRRATKVVELPEEGSKRDGRGCTKHGKANWVHETGVVFQLQESWTSEQRLWRKEETTELCLNLDSGRFKLYRYTAKDPKELYTHVQSITDQMDEKEKEVFYKEAEKEGFWIREADRNQLLHVLISIL